MYLLGYTGSDKELTLPSIDKVKEVFTNFNGDSYVIYEYAFYENRNIASVIIPNCVTIIGNSAFESCTSLTSITLPESVTSIGDYAFRNCSSLTSITIPDSVTSLGIHTFSSCSSLISIIIPDSVTNIGNYAFYNCSKLTIYCEASSRPSEWNSWWNDSNRPVYWAGEWEMVDGVPVPKE